MAKPPKPLPKPALSRREAEVAALVAQGLTNRQIAERLFISERTVDGHLEHIREKLEVTSRSQVAAWFVSQSQPGAAASALRPRERFASRPLLAIAAAALVILSASAGVVAVRLRMSSHGTPVMASSQLNGALKPVWATNGDEYPFSWPGSVALGLDGTVYVLDRGNESVQKRDSLGAYVTSWGGAGAGDGQFITYCPPGVCPPACTTGCHSLPGSLAVDREGRVWVLDYTGRVQVFDDAGRWLFKWGKKGTGEGELSGAGFIAFDSAGNVVIADDAPHVQRFDPNGRYLGQIGRRDQFIAPGSVAIDSHDDVYVADFGANKILKYSSAGRLLWSITAAVLGPQVLVVDRNDDLWVLENPGGLDNPRGRLKKFDPGGHLLRAWIMSGLKYPFGLAIDATGEAFITDLPGGAVPNVGRLSKVIPLR